MTIGPKGVKKVKLSLPDEKLMASLEKVIDTAITTGTAHKDLKTLYIELPKSAFKLGATAESALLSKYKAAGWKKAEMDHDYRENIPGIRLYE